MISIALYPYKTVCLNIQKKKDKLYIVDKIELEPYLNAFIDSDENRMIMMFSEIKRYFKEKQSIIYLVVPDHQFKKVLFDNYTRQTETSEEIIKWINDNRYFDIDLQEYYYSLPMYIASQSTKIKTLYAIEKKVVDAFISVVKQTNNILASLEPLSYAVLRGNCDFKNESTFIEIDDDYTEAVSFETNNGLFKNTMPEISGKNLKESFNISADVYDAICNIDLSCKNNFIDINGSRFFVFASDEYKKYLLTNELKDRIGNINKDKIQKYVYSKISIDIEMLPAIGSTMQLVCNEDKNFFEPKSHVATFYSANVLPDDAISINKILAFQLRFQKVLKISSIVSVCLFIIGFFINMFLSVDTIPKGLTNDFKVAKIKMIDMKKEKEIISQAHKESQDIPDIMNKIISMKPDNTQLGLTKIIIGTKGNFGANNNDWITLSVRAANPVACKDYMDSLATIDDFNSISITQINNNTNGGKNAKYKITKPHLEQTKSKEKGK